MIIVSEKMTARISAVQSAARKMMAAMTACTDAQFRERIDIINKLVEIWSNGEDVDLKCNEQEELSINDTHQRGE